MASKVGPSASTALIAFSALALAFLRFTHKHCLQIPWLRTHVVVWNWFLIWKNCWLIYFFVTFVGLVT